METDKVNSSQTLDVSSRDNTSRKSTHSSDQSHHGNNSFDQSHHGNDSFDQSQHNTDDLLNQSYDKDDSLLETEQLHSHESQKMEDDSGVPIDRGWAWMIVVGCFVMHILAVGGIKSFGVFFVELESRFTTSSRALGFVQAVASTLMLGLGPVSNALAVRFSSRSVVMVGGVFAGTGFISSAFIPSFPWLYLTYGVLTGIGFGLSYAPFVVMVGHHFVKRRSLANGISVAGSGVGQFILPNLVRYLLNEYSFQGCLLIVGGLMLNISVCGALIRPMDSYKKKVIVEKEKEALDTSFDLHNTSGSSLTEKNKLLDKRLLQLSHEDHPLSSSIRSLDTGSVHHKNRLLDSKMRYFSEDVPELHGSKQSLDSRRKPPQRFYSVETDHPNSKSSPPLQRKFRHLSETASFRSETSLFASAGDLVIASLQNIPEQEVEIKVEVIENVEKMSHGLCDCCKVSGSKSKKSVPLFDWALLVNPVFIVYLCSVLVTNFGYPNTFIMLPSYCEELGIDRDTAALLFSLIGISDLTGRLFFGWFSDLKFFPRRYGFLGTMAISGMLSILLSQIKYYEMLVFYCCTFGFFAGSYIALIAVVLVDCLGVEKLSSAFGLTTLAMSVSLLAGPPIVGGIRDVTGSWGPSFVFSGMGGIMGAAIVLCEPMAQRRLKAQQQANKDLELKSLDVKDHKVS